MEINLEQAFDEPVDLSHQLDVPLARLDRPELVALGPVAFQGRLQKSEVGFVLSGRIDFDGAVACARCLADVPFARHGPVTWVFVPAHKSVEAEEAGETELAEGDLDVVVYDDLTVNFDPLVDEQIQLELPMKALCKDTCRGLCPTCGANLNEAPCSCPPVQDDRWGALKSLLPPT